MSQCPDGTPPPCESRPFYHAPAPPPNSVAVLYFESLSRDSGDVYLADGVTEELINHLGSIARLSVKSRTAAQRFRGHPLDDPATLGRTLGVSYLVSGTVRHEGARLRVTAELTRAATGLRVWGDAFERDEADLMSVEEEIGSGIAAAVAGQLLPAERRTLAARPTRSAEAYDRFLRGNHDIAERTPAAARRAVAEYQAAIRDDPAFAEAYGRLALAYGLFIDWGWTLAGFDAEHLAVLGLAATDTALRLDSGSTDGWLARAYLLRFRHPATYEGVVQAFARAVALDSRNAETHQQFGFALSQLGRDSAAAVEFRRALQLDPDRGITYRDFAYLRYDERRIAEATALVDSGLVREPGACYLLNLRARLSLASGDATRARASLDAAPRDCSSDYSVSIAALQADLMALEGDSAGARARLAELRGPASPPSVLPTIAIALVHAGDADGAVRLLEGLRENGIHLWYAMRDPAFDPIRADARFRTLETQVRPREAP